jgi:predicted phosphodiesterase
MSSVPHSRSETFTRIGVIGDIHTRADRLEWALRVLGGHEVEQIFATGDIVDGPEPESIARVCKLLQDHQVRSVLGNHDRWLLDGQHRERPDATFPDEVDRATRAFLQRLPQTAELQTTHGTLLLGHGLGNNDMSCLYPHDHGPALKNNTTLQAILHSERYRFVVSGHTHLRMVRELSGATFINAGALHYTREPCCLILDFAAKQAQFFDHVKDGDASFTHGPSYEL